MFNGLEVIEKADLKKYCTFKIGGRGTIVFPKNVVELKKLIRECQKLNKNYFILGNGSNLLFSDFEINTILVSLKYFNEIRQVKKDEVFVGAGVNLFPLNIYLKNHNLSGLEWSYGIPGSIGGAIFMNAGAFGHSISENILNIKVLKCGKVENISKKNLEFSYRKSNINGIILGATMKFKEGNLDEIAFLQQDYLERRKISQPYDKFSAGSVFKRNIEKNIIPAKLIDTLGLKGTRIGGAEISKKHAGFIVNNGDAKAIDVLALIEYIKYKTGEDLELEIIYVK